MEYEMYVTEDGLYYVVGEYGQTDCYELKESAITAYIAIAKDYLIDSDLGDDDYFDVELNTDNNVRLELGD